MKPTPTSDSSDSMTSKLQPLLDAAAKACPFCGARPHLGSELRDTVFHPDGVVFDTMVTCLTKNCPANKVWCYIHAWNQRVDHRLVSLELRLREYVKELHEQFHVHVMGPYSPPAATDLAKYSAFKTCADRIESLMEGK